MSESAIFKAAVKLAPERRAAYLDQTCGVNPDLRREIESLLRAHDASGSFLEDPPARPQATADYPPITEGPGTLIGPYKLLQQIGEGGMGVVYMAEQQEPVRRKVALKIIKPGMDSRQVIARFEAERQALAMMDHQNIAKVLDAGTTGVGHVSNVPFTSGHVGNVPHDGRPYFVMELVHGIALTTYCDDKQLTPRQRLELFVPICQAIQHAHQKGIIHRDLKPSNILVTMYDDKPVPKVIDFGVAKAVEQRLTEKTLFTQFGTLVGTFEYMSPEQAEMNAFGVDTRSDIYSLGVLLYELLTGTTPLERQRLREAAYGDIVRLIKEEEPPRPSMRLSSSGAALAGISQQRGSEPDKLTRLVRGELDWIVMRCLEKDRTRRYETANDLAHDVERYLKDEPVEACPPTTGYKLRKFARKHQKLLATAAAFAVLLLLGVAGSAWQAVRATQAEEAARANEQQANINATQAKQNEKEANQQRDEVQALNEKLRSTQTQLQRTLYAAHMNLAQHAWNAGGVERVADLLEQHRPKAGESDLRGFEWHYLYRLSQAPLLTLKDARGPLAYSPDGKRLASGSKVWDAQTGQELLSLKGRTNGVNCVAFSPDGKRLATGSRGPGKGGEGPAEVKVWDAQTGEELFTLKGHTRWVFSVAFSPDGKRLASAAYDQTVKVWDAQTGKELLTFKGHKGNVMSVAFSPDGKRLTSGSRTWDNAKSASVAGEVKVWDAQTGEELLSLKGHANGVESVAFSPDGKQLASGTAGPGFFGEGPGELKVWDAQTGQELFSLQGLSGMVTSVAFSPDGKRLASGVADSVGSGGPGHVKVWDTQTGQQLFTLKDKYGVMSVAFSPDGKRLASVGAGVNVWDAQTGNPLVIKVAATFVASVAISPDGKRLATARTISEQGKESVGEVKVWDAQTGKELITLKGPSYGLYDVVFSPDGKRLASTALVRVDFMQRKAGAGGPLVGEVKVWDAQTGEELLSLKGGGASVAFSPDGKRLASTSTVFEPGKKPDVKVWDAQTGKELVSLEGGGTRVAFSPDGKRLAVAYRTEVKLWDAQTGEELHSFKDVGRSVAFSPDGNRLAITSQDNSVKVWDAQTGHELLTLKGHTSQLGGVTFSPDGKRLASASDDKTVKVWDAQTGQELVTLKGGGISVAFSPDGHRLASLAADGTVKIWDATPLAAKP